MRTIRSSASRRPYYGLRLAVFLSYPSSWSGYGDRSVPDGKAKHHSQSFETHRSGVKRKAEKVRATIPNGAAFQPEARRAVKNDRARLDYEAAISAYLKANESGKKAEAFAILKPRWSQIVEYQDYGTMAALAYLAMEQNDEETAMQAARTAADEVEDDDFYQVLADVALHFKRYDEAEDAIRKMSASPEREKQFARVKFMRALALFEEARYPETERMLLPIQDQLDAGGLEILGWTYYHLHQLGPAADRFEQSYRKKPGKGAAQGLVFSLHELQDYQRLLAIQQAVPGGDLDKLLNADTRARMAAGDNRFTVDGEGHLIPLRQQSSVQSQNATEHSQSTAIRLSPIYREKSGSPGESWLKMSGMEALFTWQGEKDVASLSLPFASVNDGVRTHKGFSAYGHWRHLDDHGNTFQAGLGLTPSGGPVSPAWVGEFGVGKHDDTSGLALTVFRRGNQESALAMLGKRDSSGTAWGRVLETGLRLDGHTKVEKWDFLASLTASDLIGEGVADNRKLEWYARALRPIDQVLNLQLGAELYASHFDKNLSYFEPGHGGYFSPSRFIRLGPIASYAITTSSLKMRVEAGAGWAASQQEAAPGNPITGAFPGKYPASSSSGFSYHVRAEGVYELDDLWSLGFRLGREESPGYNDNHVGIFVQRNLDLHLW